MNEPPATSIFETPSADGVNVAVYTVPEVPFQLLNAPLVTVISPTTKSAVASLDVNVSASVASFVVVPALTSVAVISTVGAVVFTNK